MIGVYKITNPKGCVYVGSSIDINKRFRTYKTKNCKSQTTKITNNMKTEFSKAILGIICIVLSLIAAAIFTGCITDLKIERKIEKININHPSAVAMATRKLYPCIVTRQSHDTTFVQGDSVINYVEVPCPDVVLPSAKHDTIHHIQYIKEAIKTVSQKEIIHDKIFVEDSAKIFIANNISVKLQKQLDSVTESRNGWRKFGWIAIAIFVIVILISAIKFGAKISLPIKV